MDLEGITVLVTRPAHQSGGVIQRLQDAGATTVLIPALSIHGLTPLKPNGDYDMVFFVSANAVRFFPDAVECLGKVRVAAIGQQTAEALKEAGLEPSLVPASGFTTEALVALPDLQELTGQRCLIVKGAGGRRALQETLAARGAVVDCVDVYRREPIDEVQGDHWQLFRSAKQPIAMFTSGDSLRYFRAALKKVDETWFDQVPKIVGSERIAAVAEELSGSRVNIHVADDPTDDAMIKALRSWANERGQQA